MFNINTDDKSVPPKAILSGVIDENSNLAPLIEGRPSALYLYCRNVTRINSVGIKLWRAFFNSCRKDGRSLNFFELSPPLVSSCNYLNDFILMNEIHSLCVPFVCEACAKHTNLIFSIDELKKNLPSPLAPECANCGAATEMNEIPEEYFAFIKG
jgi:hypothetical protein